MPPRTSFVCNLTRGRDTGTVRRFRSEAPAEFVAGRLVDCSEADDLARVGEGVFGPACAREEDTGEPPFALEDASSGANTETPLVAAIF